MTQGVAPVRALRRAPAPPGRRGVVRVAVLMGAFAALLLVAGAASALEPHAPIKIRSNADLEEFPGRGTRSSPYVIEDYEIAATQSHGVDIANTSAHVVIRGLRIANGGVKYDGIALGSVKNVTIEDTFLEGNRNGVSITSSSVVTIQRVNVNSTAVGVVVDQSRLVTVKDNVFPQNERGVLVRLSTNNTFERNRITLASGQFGFWFADNMSVANRIDTSNLVNEVPMRWYVDVKGPFTIKGAHVDLKGITNLAQMLVYRSKDVRVEDALLTNGSSRGLVVWRSEEVVVSRTNASVNEGHGVHVVDSRRVRFLDGDASLNGGDGVQVTGPISSATAVANQVGRVVAVGNKGPAVNLLFSPGAGAFDVTARGNGAGIQVVGVERGVSVADNVVTASKGDGINVTGSSSNISITGNVVERNGRDGIRVLSSGKLVHVRNNEIVANGGRGLALERVTGAAVVAENHVASNRETGLLVFRTFNSSFVDNVIERHERNVVLSNASRNRFWHDTIVKSERETGFWFQDTFSYDNPIGPNTTVNGVPVQWRVGLKGTEKKPVVLEGVAVEIANVTNVAQIGFHNSSWVVLDRARAANGPATGIFLHQSHDVRLVAPEVRDNVGSGILIRSVSGVTEARAASNVVEDAVVVGNGKAPTDAGVKIQGTAATGNVVVGSNVSGNRPAGFRLEQSGARNVLRENEVHGNARAGIVFDRATLTTVERNVVGNHSRDVEIAGSVSNLFQGNKLVIGNGSYGFFFRDEASYSNDILPDTAVNGVAVQWFTYVDGREGFPVVLRPSPVELRGITNVAQVMVYKSSWLRLEDVHAANGTDRAVYLYKSSEVEMANATARGSPVGVELGSTLSSRIVDARVTNDAVGVRLNASSGNTVLRAVAEGTKAPVRIVSSENNRIWGTNATKAASPVVDDPTFVPGASNQGKNLIVDVGLDRAVEIGEKVTFSGAVAVSPFRNEPVVRQVWDFGDGETVEAEGAGASRPWHTYAENGRYVVRLTVHTPTSTYADDAVVTVGDVDAAGKLDVKLSCDPSTINATVGENVTFECTALLVAGTAAPYPLVVKEKTFEVANFTIDLLPDGATPFSFSYVANETGDHLIRVGKGEIVHVIATEPPPPEEDKLLPGAAFGAVAALAVAAFTRARDRRR